MALSRWLTSKLPLHVAVVTPIVVLIMVSASLIAYLSLQSTQQVTEELAYQVRAELANRLEERLRGFLGVSISLLEQDAAELQPGLDPESTLRHLWHQVRAFQSVHAIFLADLPGNLLGVRRREDGTLLILRSSAGAGGRLEYFHADRDGHPGAPAKVVENYDPRQRPWYQAALARNGQTWGEIFTTAGQDSLHLPVARPVYDARGELTGVVACSLNLDMLGRFLEDLPIDRSGETFIMDRDGLLVASSTRQVLLRPGPQGPARLPAVDSDSALVRESARQLLAQHPDLKAIERRQFLELEVEGRRMYLQAQPFRDGLGIDWLTVMVLPADDLLAKANSSRQATILVCLALLCMSLILGITLSHWISEPVGAIARAASRIAQGDLEQQVATPPTQELGQLAQSFNQMARQLKETFQALRQERGQLAERVDQRTQELKHSHDLLDETQKIGRIGGWDLDPVSGQVAWTQEMFRLLDLDPTQGPDMASAEAFLAPPFREPFRSAVRQALAQGTPWQMEVRMTTAKGREIWARVMGRPRGGPGPGLRLAGTFQDITERKKAQDQQTKLIAELQQALAEVKKLSGLLPICSNCKKIRNDEGYWEQVEGYIAKHSDAQFSHGICPECIAKLYGDVKR